MKKIKNVLLILLAIIIMPYITYQVCRAFRYHDDMMLDCYYFDLMLLFNETDNDHYYKTKKL